MEELSYVLTQYFVSCVHVRFYFSLQLIFTLLVASISHCLTAALNFHVFLSTKFVSFVFNHSLYKLFLLNNVEKDTTLLLFFLSKNPGGHAISFQIKPWVEFGLPYLLIELFYIGMPVARTDGRVGGRSVYGHVITKFSRMGSLPHFFTHGATMRAPRARELRYYFCYLFRSCWNADHAECRLQTVQTECYIFYLHLNFRLKFLL